jgi:ribonuclease BN (tRNA processing enzyme)
MVAPPAAIDPAEDPRHLSAVWISHLHPDHSADLIALANWALNIDDVPKIRVIGPAGWDRRLNAFISEGGNNLVGKIFDVHYIDNETPLAIDNLTLSGKGVNHSVSSYGACLRRKVHASIFGRHGPLFCT